MNNENWGEKEARLHLKIEKEKTKRHKAWSENAVWICAIVMSTLPGLWFINKSISSTENNKQYDDVQISG